MPDPDPLPTIKTPWDSATPPSGAGTGAGNVPPIPIPDHTLIRRIGKGSYGEVWLARNVLGVYRAVKIIDRRAFDDDRPFEREFVGMQRFEPVSRSHESQLNILQVGRGPDCFYYVMELADDMRDALAPGAIQVGGTSSTSPYLPSDLEMGTHGVRPSNSCKASLDPDTYTPRNLRSELLVRGRLPVDECIRLGLALTTALGHLHRHGLVHRDIKPSNIVFVNGIPKLADIGLVALAESTMSFVGTEGYLPPEGPGTVQADLFSLGKVLYEISTGRNRQQFPELPTGITELPDRAALAEFNEVLLRACAPDVKQRYESAAEMHADLALLQSGKSVARLRAVERRLKFVARAGALVTAIAVLTGTAFLYQKVQTRDARRLADENKALAQAETKAKIQAETEQRRTAEAIQLLQIERAEGLFKNDDPATALALLAQVVRSNPSNRVAAERLLSALTHRSFALPLFAPLELGGGTAEVEFSANGESILASSGDRWIPGYARVWSTRTGEPLTPRFTNVVRARLSLDGKRLVVATTNNSAFIVGFGSESLRTITLRHAGPVRDACVSPDGQLVATASQDGTVGVWDLASGQARTPPLKHDAAPVLTEFSPDSRRIFTASEDQTVRVWSATTGELLVGPFKVLGDDLHQESSYHFAQDGRILMTTTKDFGPFFWDLRTGRKIGGPEGKVSHGDPSLSPDDQRAVMVFDDTVRIWNPQTGELLTRIASSFSASGSRASFSPDSRRLITASQGKAQVWHVDSGEPLAEVSDRNGILHSVQFSPDGLAFATGSEDKAARVWDALTGDPLTEKLLFNDYVASAKFNKDACSVVVLNFGGRRASMWNVRPGQAFPLALRHYPKINHIKFAPGDRLVATATDRNVWIWDAKTGLPTFRPAPALASDPLSQGGPVNSVEFSPEGLRIVTAFEMSGARKPYAARVWDVQTGKPLTPPLPHEGKVQTACFSPDGKWILTASFDRTARLWDAKTGQPLFQVLKHGSPVNTAAFSPDGRIILTAAGSHRHDTEDFAGHLWDAQSGRELTPPLRHYASVVFAEFSVDGSKVLTASEDNTARVWDATTGQPLTEPLGHDDVVNSAHFSKDGLLVVTASKDKTARVWEISSGKALSEPLRHRAEVRAAMFTPDTLRVVTVADHEVRIWDTKTALALSEPLHGDYAMRADFSSDGLRVATGGYGGTAELWDVMMPPGSAPAWLPDLAEAVAGKRFSTQRSTRFVPITELIRLKGSLESLPTDDWYSRWVKWFFADRAKRPIAPGSVVSVPEYVKLKVEGNDEGTDLGSLKTAIRLDPGNAKALGRLAWEIATRRGLAIKTGSADFYIQRALSISKDDPEILKLQKAIAQWRLRFPAATP